jgi:hypothetical protein
MGKNGSHVERSSAIKKTGPYSPDFECSQIIQELDWSAVLYRVKLFKKMV